MQLERFAHFWRSEGLGQSIPAVWREGIVRLTLSWAGLMLLTAREWGEMFHQYWNIDTYGHILLVPLIIAWLVSLRREVLAEIEPKSWAPGVVLVACALLVWLAGRITEINLVAQAGAVAALQAAFVAMLGVRVAAALFLPLGFMAFLVPFGDEIIPQLQMVTADIAIALTQWSGVPAHIEGIYIDTPVGLFIVAEACSGVKFLVAMVTLGTLISFTAFESWGKRVALMAACIIVPILANGARAWGTIFIAQSQGVEFAAGFDHIFYGWIFFAIIVAALLAAAWRFFEREPDEYGLSTQQIASHPVVQALDRPSPPTVWLAAGFAALLLIFLFGAIYAPSQVL